MKMKQQPNDYKLNGIFPTPVYIAKRDSEQEEDEEKEVEDIIKEGMTQNEGNSSSNNSYIFNNGKLKNIKQFCEQHLKIYVEQVINPNPKQELDLYITQSWVNLSKPGEFHHNHYHPNSIISGVYYVATEKGDGILFSDPVDKEILKSVEPKECFFPVYTKDIVLFPSWLGHGVLPNEKATTDRISLSFNTFVKGIIGSRSDKTELIL